MYNALCTSTNNYLQKETNEPCQMSWTDLFTCRKTSINQRGICRFTPRTVWKYAYNDASKQFSYSTRTQPHRNSLDTEKHPSLFKNCFAFGYTFGSTSATWNMNILCTLWGVFRERIGGLIRGIWKREAVNNKCSSYSYFVWSACILHSVLGTQVQKVAWGTSVSSC